MTPCQREVKRLDQILSTMNTILIASGVCILIWSLLTIFMTEDREAYRGRARDLLHGRVSARSKR